MSDNLIALQNKFLGHGQTVYDKLAQLHDMNGAITDADIDRMAAEFNLPPAHVRSTAKFYEELAKDVPARHEIKVCIGEACQAAGCRKIEQRLHEHFSLAKSGDVSADGVRVEHVACLGYCGLGPNAMVDGKTVSFANEAAIDSAIKAVETDSEHGLPEPVNALSFPAEGQPCIVMRHMRTSPVKLADARAAGIYGALEHALKSMTPEKVIAEVKASGLRGRGGAGFPSGIKLQTVHESPSKDGRKFVVVNADEGDAGSYIDKEIMERDPHSLIEGTLLAAFATGAQMAYFYIRFEYPESWRIMNEAVAEARAAGLVGQNILGSGFSCEFKLVKGQGAYICGEETSLLRSLEGVPAIVSFKPPFPAVEGLFGCPTAVNNVETLHNLPWIVTHGGDEYAKFGYERSRGTKAVSLNTRVAKPGMYEVELGVTLRQLIFEHAGGMASGQTFKAVQVGGPLGGIFPERLLDTPLDFEAMGAAKGLLGHAGVVVYSQEDDLIEIGRNLMHFCAVESCGKCFPCRIGAVRGTELFDQMMATGATQKRKDLMAELCETMKYGSLCALGGAIPTPIENLLEFFPEEWERYGG